jgi:hypothetical protein
VVMQNLTRIKDDQSDDKLYDLIKKREKDTKVPLLCAFDAVCACRVVSCRWSCRVVSCRVVGRVVSCRVVCACACVVSAVRS